MNDPLDRAERRVAIIQSKIRELREMVSSGEEGTFAMHDAINTIEEAADDLYAFIGVAQVTTKSALELSEEMLQARRMAMAAYRDALARLRKMGVD